jgi:branched-chain amino acid transport system permease protein
MTAAVSKSTNPVYGYAALFIAIGLLPVLGVYPIFVMKVLCYALFACAFNLLIGFTGLLSFGHAAFLGTAAYTAGHALKVWGLPAPVGLLVGTFAAAGVGLLFGLLAIKRTGIYFSMITLALSQMLFFFFLQVPFTGGEDGLQSVPRGSLFGLNLESDISLFYVVLAIFIAGFWLIYRTVHSPFGQVLTSIRENEPRAISLGYDTDRFKLLAFVLSAGLAGLAGATKTLVLGFATLTDAVWTTSGLVILMTLVGGMGTLVGPMVGALVIISLENKIGDLGKALANVTGIDWFNGLGESVSLVTGLIFIICVLAFRRGLVGEALALRDRFRSK